MMVKWKLELSNIIIEFPDGYYPGVKWNKVNETIQHRTSFL